MEVCDLFRVWGLGFSAACDGGVWCVDCSLRSVVGCTVLGFSV